MVRDTAAFEAKYGSGLPVAGQYAGSLNNAGERIELLDAAGTVIHDFRFEDDWFDITDGLGFSLTVKDPQTADPNAYDDKSSGGPAPRQAARPARTTAARCLRWARWSSMSCWPTPRAAGPDWIELHNTTDQAIDIGGWFLSDDANNLTKYEIAAGTSIAADGYIVFYENRHFGKPGRSGLPGALRASAPTARRCICIPARRRADRLQRAGEVRCLRGGGLAGPLSKEHGHLQLRGPEQAHAGCGQCRSAGRARS